MEKTFPIGSSCLCVSTIADGTKVSLPVRVLDHREGGLVYIHYQGNDARLDEWVPLTRLTRSLNSASQDSSEDVHDVAPNHVTGGTRKRKHSIPSSRDFHGAGSDSDGDCDGNGGGGNPRKIWHHGAGHGDEHTKVRNIQRIQLGEHVIDAWYYSPYPSPYDKFVEKLYICEDTFKYMTSPKVFARHRASLQESQRVPPGLEVYRDPNLTVFRVEGTRERLYCQNLCLLGKLFIEHKTLHYDPNPFYFFVICERYIDHGAMTRYRPVGYFSKEKDSPDQYNLACILTLPPFQRKGYGKFIISLSYELSKREGKLGSPEKPLSDLGKLSYRAFWSCRLLTLLKEACEQGTRPGVRDLAQQTGIRIEDTVSTLQALGFIKQLRGSLVLAVTLEQVSALLDPYFRKNFTSSFCDPECFLIGNNTSATSTI
jgi:histone acetyltransferase MYST1